ncbi:MAG: hypothetical protein IKL65_05075 [Bacilli bacterium]|nr:hypothetical protein [Bacilli bacterium]
MIYIIIIFSFLFESIFSNIVVNHSFLTPLFLLTSLSILYPYFKNKKFNFVIVCIICGLFYDIAFTNSQFINTISFGICSGFIILAYNYVNYNIFSSNFINIINIILYRIISYLLLCIIDFVKFNEFSLLERIYNSLLVNIIYGIIIFVIINLLAKIFNTKRIE